MRPDLHRVARPRTAGHDRGEEPVPARPGGAVAPADGFTLLEALVAFVLAALALGVLFGGLLSGLRAADTASRTEDALSRARSHLDAAVTALGSAGEVEQGGDDGGGFRWSLSVRTVGRATARRERRVGLDPTIANALTLYRLDVTVSFDGGARQVHLATERLAVGLPHAT